MHTAFALLSASGAMMLIWLVMRNLDTGFPTTAETTGLVVVIFLLLMLTAVLLVAGPVSADFEED